MDPESVALLIENTLRGILALQGRATVAVSPGPTLLAAFSMLAGSVIAWDRVRFLMADELAGPPSDPRSRYRGLYEAFFSKVATRPGQVLRFWSEGAPPKDVAGYYGQMAAEVLDLPAGELPQLDLVLLEMGPDGGVGSFAPGSPALAKGGGFALPVEIAGELHYTLSGDLVRHASRVYVVGPARFESSPLVVALRPSEGEFAFLGVPETGFPGVASQG